MRKQEMVKLETKRRIMYAFWELYKKTNIEKITVKSITDACGIYRTTFYLHFADVYAILEQIEEELLCDVKRIRSEVTRNAADRDRMMPEICRCFEQNYEYLYILLDRKHDPKFASLYKREITDLICTVNQVDLNTLNSEAQEIAVKSFSAMLDLFLALGESKHVSVDRIMLILDGYMKNGIIHTLRSLYGN